MGTISGCGDGCRDGMGASVSRPPGACAVWRLRSGVRPSAQIQFEAYRRLTNAGIDVRPEWSYRKSDGRWLRFDLVIFLDATPFAIIECKSYNRRDWLDNWSQTRQGSQYHGTGLPIILLCPANFEAEIERIVDEI